MKYAELVKAVNEVLAQYRMKLTLRQVYYRLVAKNLIPNTPTSYKGLSKQLVKAREDGDVNGNRIEDRGRKVQGEGDLGYESVEDFVKSMVKALRNCGQYYSRLMWANQPKKVLVALEKDALSRLFVETANRYRVQVYATRGYSSYTFLNDMAQDFDGKKENVVLYFGDFDPSGRDIERDLEDRLIRYGAGKFEIRRIALTEDQIREYNLPPMPEDADTLAKLERDPRTAKYGMEFAVELDAIEPPVLQGLIENAILGEIKEDIWNQTAQEAEEQKAECVEKMEGTTIQIDGETV